MKKFGILALVAMMSLFTLVVTSCSKPSTPAPAEKVVNLSDLPPLYKSGQILEFPSYDSTTYRWMDCKDGSMHFGTKLIPGMPKIVITQGEHAALEKILGVSEGKELILREKDETSPTPVTKPNPEPMVKKPSVSADEETPASLAGNIPWHWLGWVLLFSMAIIALYILLGLLRRMKLWVDAPLSRHSVQTHTSTAKSDNDGRVHNMIQFRDRGPNPTSFSVQGNFHLPLEVRVEVKGEVGTFRFGYPNKQDGQSNGNRRREEHR